MGQLRLHRNHSYSILGYGIGNYFMTKNEVDRERGKLVSRAKRIRGQIEAVERALSDEKEDCADTLQLLAACRGAINSLMAEVMEDHIRDHIGRGRASEEVTDDVLAVVRAYLK